MMVGQNGIPYSKGDEAEQQIIVPLLGSELGYLLGMLMANREKVVGDPMLLAVTETIYRKLLGYMIEFHPDFEIKMAKLKELLNGS